MMIEGIDLTLGVEEEYQIVNPETRDLDSYVRQFLEDGSQFTPHSSVRPELMQSQIEAGSSVCSSVPEVRSEIIRMRRQVKKMADEHGMAIASAGTHPLWYSSARAEKKNREQGQVLYVLDRVTHKAHVINCTWES